MQSLVFALLYRNEIRWDVELFCGQSSIAATPSHNCCGRYRRMSRRCTIHSCIPFFFSGKITWEIFTLRQINLFFFYIYISNSQIEANGCVPYSCTITALTSFKFGCSQNLLFIYLVLGAGLILAFKPNCMLRK
jgi:hypothetical protein